jgi:hypothetical protein
MKNYFAYLTMFINKTLIETEPVLMPIQAKNLNSEHWVLLKIPLSPWQLSLQLLQRSLKSRLIRLKMELHVTNSLKS